MVFVCCCDVSGGLKMENKMIGIFSDIDGTMLGDAVSLKELNVNLKKERNKFILVYASGRSFAECINAINDGGLIVPDAFIACTGAEIYINDKGAYNQDTGWEKLINTAGWDAGKIREVLSVFGFLEPQAVTGKYKISYRVPEAFIEQAENMAKKKLSAHNLNAKVIASHGIYIDVLPEKCDKGTAAEYTAQKFFIDKKEEVVAGDSGNDADMFARFENGIIVGNARAEILSVLLDTAHYRAKSNYASGVLEGLKHYFPGIFGGNL
jgi:sucrose-phosphate synthase